MKIAKTAHAWHPDNLAILMVLFLTQLLLWQLDFHKYFVYFDDFNFLIQSAAVVSEMCFGFF